jgi:hypothetical protein
MGTISGVLGFFFQASHRQRGLLCVVALTLLFFPSFFSAQKINIYRSFIFFKKNSLFYRVGLS